MVPGGNSRTIHTFYFTCKPFIENINKLYNLSFSGCSKENFAVKVLRGFVFSYSDLGEVNISFDLQSCNISILPHVSSTIQGHISQQQHNIRIYKPVIPVTSVGAMNLEQPEAMILKTAKTHLIFKIFITEILNECLLFLKLD